MVDLNALARENADRWSKAKQTRTTSASMVARRLVDAKKRYQTVESKTGVPWWVIAVIHERESSQDWTTHLGQGDPLNKVTVHVPAGRGPFFGSDAWERGAIDALVDCAPYLARKNNWSTPGGVLTNLETYNGLRYASSGRPSPYVWSGTSIYDPPSGPGGKVVVDHGPIDNSVIDKQLGCAAMLMAMMTLDPSINLSSPKVVAAAPVAPDPTVKPSQPSITNPSPGSIGAFIASILAAIFKRNK